jgi:hypothetical protein
MTEPKKSEEEAQQELIVERERMKEELEQLKKERVWASGVINQAKALPEALAQRDQLECDLAEARELVLSILRTVECRSTDDKGTELPWHVRAKAFLARTDGNVKP